VLSTQTYFDVAQALAVSQLGEGHTEKLIEAGKRLNLMVAVVTLNTPSKGVQRHLFDHLCENEFACIFSPEPSAHESAGEARAKGLPHSSR
jgi:hypothetical protein